MAKEDKNRLEAFLAKRGQACYTQAKQTATDSEESEALLISLFERALDSQRTPCALLYYANFHYEKRHFTDAFDLAREALPLITEETDYLWFDRAKMAILPEPLRLRAMNKDSWRIPPAIFAYYLVIQSAVSLEPRNLEHEKEWVETCKGIVENLHTGNIEAWYTLNLVAPYANDPAALRTLCNSHLPAAAPAVAASFKDEVS